jgi:protein-histidine pros-kinase
MVTEFAVARGASARSNVDAADDLAQFAKVVSHDFSAPLRTIRGFAGLIDDTLCKGADDGVRTYASEIIAAVERMQALNDGLVSCIRARSARLDPTDVSLDSVVRECLATFDPRIVELGARVTASKLPVVRADAAAVTLVLHHLLDNALRHAVAGRAPTITIAATRSAMDWTIVVRDDGPGIAEISRERVFTLFKRLQPDREPLRPGVGLTLCRTVIERHGGRIWVAAAVGGGTEATFTLPTSLAAAETASDTVGGENVCEPSWPVQNEAALAAIVEFSDDAMFSKDLNGLIITWNRAAGSLYGYSASEAIGQHVSMLLPPRQVIELPALMTEVNAGRRAHLETVRRRKDGKLIDVSLMISPIKDPQGQAVAAAVTARDVTERHRVDQDLRAFLEVAPDAIVVIDRTGAISAVNTQAEAIFGYTRDALVGQPLEMLLPERFRDGHVAKRLSFAAAPTLLPMGSLGGLFGLKRDGTEFPVDIQLSSLVTKDGTFPVAAIRDVTERRRLEHLRDDFIGNAAHELRTPLTTLAGLGETLARSFDVMSRSDIEEAFAAMERQGDRAKVLISNLLDLSNVEGERADFTIVGVALEALIHRVLEAAPVPEDKAVTVAVAGDLQVLADPNRLEQVVSNLLVNSYRYGGREIRVSALQRESRVILSVNDDGGGIAADYVPTLFEPFTRGKEANVVRGSGIGLALCRRIVQGMDGDIWYERLAPHGASFRVSLRSPS